MKTIVWIPAFTLRHRQLGIYWFKVVIKIPMWEPATIGPQLEGSGPATTGIGSEKIA
jgi:hypothetical protein